MIEKNVLGYLLNNTSYYFAYYQQLKPEMFAEHQDIFEKYVALVHTSKPSLYELSKFFPYELLSKISSGVDFSITFAECIRILRDEYTLRKLTALGMQLSFGSTGERMKILEDTLNDITGSEIHDVTTISEGIDRVFDMIVKSRTDGLSGVGTGLEEYDKFTGGLQSSDLIIIAGETSQGKTSLALTMLRHAVTRFGARVCVFSYEMTDRQIIARLIAQASGINSKRLMTSKVSDEEIEEAKKKITDLKDAKLFIDPCKNTSIDYLCNNLRAYKMRYDINIAVVDYLQLLKGETRVSREQEVGNNARRLKNLAKELNITVVALSQLSREKGSPKPTLNRLRDSGQIEEAADQVLFVYRPEMYGIEHFDDTDISTCGMAHVFLAKGRNVGICNFYLNFDKHTTEFTNYKSYDFSETPRDFTAPF